MATGVQTVPACDGTAKTNGQPVGTCAQKVTGKAGRLGAFLANPGTGQDNIIAVQSGNLIGNVCGTNAEGQIVLINPTKFKTGNGTNVQCASIATLGNQATQMPANPPPTLPPAPQPVPDPPGGPPKSKPIKPRKPPIITTPVVASDSTSSEN